jgi:uncharacterized membrane protein
MLLAMSAILILMILIVLSALPVFVVYLWFRLAKFKITLKWFLFVLLLGAAAFLPAVILQTILPDSLQTGGRLELFYLFFVRVASTEEISRLLLLILFFAISARREPESAIEQASGDEHLIKTKIGQPVSWNTVKKGAATGLVAGLGFAVLVSAAYGISNTDILLLRAVTAAPLHAACASRVGIAAVMVRSNPFQAVSRLLAAIGIHGAYNFILEMPGLPSMVAVLIALMTLASSIATISGGWNGEDKPQDLDKTTENL